MTIATIGTGWRRLRQQIFKRTQRDDAEDLLQNAIVRMLQRPHGDIARPEAFVVRVALNEAVDGYRRARHPAAPRSLGTDDLYLRDQAPLPDEMLMVRQRLDRVHHGLEQLPPRTREIFLMHRLDGMKYREIAEALDISISTVEKHVARAMTFIANWAEGW